MGSHAGSVKWFNNTKGFGFITPAEEGSKDVFVHQSQIRSNGFRYLKEGEAVEYDVQTTDRGVVASDVTAPGGVPLHLAREDNGDEQM
ncbi:cspC [Symbiodinium sp. KB8]|nr:cspC [Symbiodinium sp. KB8]